MGMRAAAFVAEVWMTVSTWASVPTGQPRTGWPGAMVDPSPRRIASAFAWREGNLGSPRRLIEGPRSWDTRARVVGSDKEGP